MLVRIMAGLLLAPALGAAQQPAAPAAAPAQGTYQLVAGDHIDVKFFYRSDLNDSVVVRPDGFISLQLVGDVRAEGQTPTALAAELDQRYGTVLKNPQAAVIVRQFGGRRVYVTGEVTTPGVVQMAGITTALQAIAASGGFRNTARTGEIVLIRHAGGNQAVVQRLDANRILKGTAADVPLVPYDVVYVPRSRIAQLDLWVDQYVNSLVPRPLLFPYNLNSEYTIR